MIHVRNLTKDYADLRRGKFSALAGITFDAFPGEIYGLLGPNGAGKTTALRIISTVLRPTEGSASVNGNDVLTQPSQVRKQIGFMSANTGTYDRMTAWEMVEFFGRLYGLSDELLRSRMEELFSRLNMNEIRDQLVAKMSTGMKQKVSIARALVHDPPVLIFDEATSGLDVLVARALLNTVAELRDQGKCIVFSTHIMREAEKLCSRIAIMFRGHILAEGTLAELQDRHKERDLEELFFRLISEHERRRTEAGELPDEHVDRAVAEDLRLGRLEANPRAMNWRNVRLVLVREVRDQLRDRRTLFMIVVLPLLLYPLLGMSLFQITQFIHEQPTKVLIVGFQEPPDFPPLLRTDSDGTLHFADELFRRAASVRLLSLTTAQPESAEPVEVAAKRAVQDGEYAAVVHFPPDFNEKLIGFRSRLQKLDDASAASPAESNDAALAVPSPEIYYHTAKEKSQLAYVRLKEVLDTWSDAIGRHNLASRNLPESTAKPFDYEPFDVAEEDERDAALWSKILPFLLLIWALTGAFYPAVDLCAGEKERGTLETLLSSPAERIDIVWGKLLTVMLFSVTTAVLNILSMGITGSIVMSQLPNFGPPPPLAPLWLFLALLPISALFSALCIALASFARSTKEGQYYLMPLVLITLPLVVLPMAPSIELNLGMSLIPITGVVLLLKSLLEGRYLEVLPYTLTVGAVTGGCCLLALRWAVDLFNSENVLFREGERGGLGLWIRHLVRDREETPSVAESLLCGVLIMTVYFFMTVAMPHPGTFRDFMIGAVLTQFAVILTPTLLMTAICTRSPRQTLLLHAPKVASIVGAVVLALVLHPSILVLGEVLQRLYPINPELLKIGALLEGGETWILVVALALVPAIVEELAFRGFILSGLRRIGNRRQAVVVAAIFFALCHGTAVQQAINAGLLGLLLGYLAIQSGNIFTGMAFHATSNAAALIVPTLVGDFILRSSQWSWVAKLSADGKAQTYHPLIIAAGIVVAGAILRGFAKLPAALSYEEELTEAIRQRSSEATAA